MVISEGSGAEKSSIVKYRRVERGTRKLMRQAQADRMKGEDVKELRDISRLQ